jgi:hypothetical protein
MTESLLEVIETNPAFPVFPEVVIGFEKVAGPLEFAVRFPPWLPEEMTSPETVIFPKRAVRIVLPLVAPGSDVVIAAVLTLSFEEVMEIAPPPLPIPEVSIVLREANPFGDGPPAVTVRAPPWLLDKSRGPKTVTAPLPELIPKANCGPLILPFIVTSPPVNVSISRGVVMSTSPVSVMVPPVVVIEPPRAMGVLERSSVVAVIVMMPGPVEVTDDPVLNPWLPKPLPPTIELLAVKSPPVENIPCKSTP